MNLLKDKSLLRDLLYKGDLLNTISGGVVQTTFDIEQTAKGMYLSVEAPGVEAWQYSVFMHGENLHVLLETPTAQDNSENLEDFMNIPMAARAFKIPKNAITEAISAEFDMGQLNINIPLEGISDRQNEQVMRKINIRNRMDT